MGGLVKKIFLLLFIAVFAAAPAGAAPKQKSNLMTYEEAMAHNANSWRLVKEGLPLVLPSWAQVIYFSYKNANKPQAGAQKKR